MLQRRVWIEFLKWPPDRRSIKKWHVTSKETETTEQVRNNFAAEPPEVTRKSHSSTSRVIKALHIEHLWKKNKLLDFCVQIFPTKSLSSIVKET